VQQGRETIDPDKLNSGRHNSSSETPSSEFRVPNFDVPVVMTIAGSDSGGGAGIQADLKTFSALGVFGTSAITCVTAQNPNRITRIKAIDPEMVSLQIKTVCEGFSVAAAKTGMLYSASIIRMVSRTLTDCDIPTLVVDPVMVATCGERLLRENAVEALCSDLFPKATIITPNVPEAEILCGHSIKSFDEMKAAAREIGEKFGTACVVKGGHLGNAERGTRSTECGMRNTKRGSEEDSELRVPSSELGTRDVIDVLYDGGKLSVFSSKRVNAVETHGTGCAFSAALTACLAQGETLEHAVERAGKFVASALARAHHVGRHRPLNLSLGPN